MRISTVTMFESSLSSMNRQQSAFLDVGQQLATGRRVVNPSDDPQAASRAVSVSQSMAVSQQYADARVTARNALSQEESVLNSVGDAISSAKTLMVQAGNGTLSDADRSAIASELRGIYESLLGQANTTNGNGDYLFGGVKDNASPFVKQDGKVVYQGADSVRAQQVDSSRRMPVGDSGLEVFSGVHAGSDYVAEATTAADSTLTFTGPSVRDASADGFGESYTLTFTDSTTFSITDRLGNEVLNDTYTAGEPIEFKGMSITLEGEPKQDDVIEMAKGQDQSVFATLENALAALEAPADTSAKRADLSNTLSSVSRQLDNSLDNVLTVRASVGARLNELDVLDTVGGNRTLNYESTLSELVDLDYASAISDYTLRQVGLQASQKTFVDMRGMSLFEML
ncbi:flagellar hook-associated protein FlgL [Halomonas sp. HP20-15]|uniref:flagellar hook-associated protein FlgL n=1 Tax=Halomonas sp. HP20-15 TaxID=3085901 RepID=UPI00298242B3|nr:flagellar hook-associated protein FlgL [Halomonas sp. HP20-15]MDW5375312.1 flagellar hook-associated protein FlgL [Halomonas sp. HP20-15]